MIIPRALEKGDTIAFISPSLRFNTTFPKPLERAKQWLERSGFKVIVIFNEQTKPDFQDDVLQRCEEVHAAFRDPSVKGIVCTVGGSTANELLPHLDYELIRSNPKIFCGFSDISVLHCAIFTQTGLRTFYGPTALEPLGEYPEPSAFSGDNFTRILTEAGREPLGPVPSSASWAPQFDEFFRTNPQAEVPRGYVANPGWRWLRQGSAKGRIFGGCLNSLSHLSGTRYWPDFHGRVFFVETSTGENLENGVPFHVLRSQLADLRNLGLFDIIQGLIVGRAYGYAGTERAKEYDEIVLQQTRGHSFPILTDVDIGHTSPILTVPLDTLVELDSGSNKFDILEPSVV